MVLLGALPQTRISQNVFRNLGGVSETGQRKSMTCEFSHNISVATPPRLGDRLARVSIHPSFTRTNQPTKPDEPDETNHGARTGEVGMADGRGSGALRQTIGNTSLLFMPVVKVLSEPSISSPTSCPSYAARPGRLPVLLLVPNGAANVGRHS